MVRGWLGLPRWGYRHYFYGNPASACGVAEFDATTMQGSLAGDTPEEDAHPDNCLTCQKLAPLIRRWR